jgi:hypothetical protein
VEVYSAGSKYTINVISPPETKNFITRSIKTRHNSNHIVVVDEKRDAVGTRAGVELQPINFRDRGAQTATVSLAAGRAAMRGRNAPTSMATADSFDALSITTGSHLRSYSAYFSLLFWPEPPTPLILDLAS